MLKRSYLISALCACCLLLLVACSSEPSANTNSPAAAANANRSTAGTASTPVPASTTAAAPAGDKVGVAECDDYLAKVDKCVASKVPEAARAQYRSGIEQTRKSWRDLAANPQTRGSLAAACKTAVESARQTYKGFGCEF
jgi:hypothetical protein